MKSKFWANRILSYWTPCYPAFHPGTEYLNLEYIEKIRPQVLQIGHFGPLFFSMCHTDHWDYFGVPVRGMHEGIAWWRKFVSSVQALDIKVVGLISLSFHFGDHCNNEGWFRFWNDLWDENLLGPRPCEDPLGLLQINEDGTYKFNPRGGETQNWYSGCLNNPHWIETLKSMVRHAIQDIGLDGFNTVYNYVMGCCCSHCQAGLRKHLKERYSAAELKKFGIDDIDAHTFQKIPFHFEDSKGGPLELECVKFANLSLKRTFDQIFTDYGRSIKPDLITATWYHQSGDETFGQLGNDERSALPSELWSRDEDYLWYCLGRQEHTRMQDGHLGDVVLETKYLRAAGRGKPFIPNRYDHRRLALYIAESVASGGAAIGWHWDTSKRHPPDITEQYIDILGGYFRFVERRESLYHPVESYADTALIFSRTSVQRGYPLFGRSLKRLGRRLADGHVLFDMVLDEQIDELSCAKYKTMVFPDAKYISDHQLEWIRAYLRAGGQVVLTESSFLFDHRGNKRETSELADLIPPHQQDENLYVGRFESGRVIYIPQVPRDEISLAETSRLAGPPIGRDAFGREFLQCVRTRSNLLTTSASWTVFFHAYIQSTPARIVLHVVNYDNDETAESYAPIPTTESDFTLQVPEGSRVESMVFSTPETGEDVQLNFTQEKDDVSFCLPPISVYGLAVINLTRS